MSLCRNPSVLLSSVSTCLHSSSRQIAHRRPCRLFIRRPQSSKVPPEPPNPTIDGNQDIGFPIPASDGAINLGELHTPPQHRARNPRETERSQALKSGDIGLLPKQELCFSHPRHEQKYQEDFFIPEKYLDSTTASNVRELQLSESEKWWWCNFRGIYTPTGFQKTTIRTGKSVQFHSRTHEWIQQLVGTTELRDRASIERVWRSTYFQEDYSPTVWVNVALKLIAERRLAQLVHFIAATAQRPFVSESSPEPIFPSPSMVHSALKAASIVWAPQLSKFTNSIDSQLAASFSHILSFSIPISATENNTPLHYLLATQASRDWLPTFYISCSNKMTVWTQLHWAYAFLYSGDVKKAIEVMEAVKPPETYPLESVKQEITKIGATIMRHIPLNNSHANDTQFGNDINPTQGHSEPDGPELAFLHIIKLFRGLGVTDCTSLYNAFIINAFEQGNDLTALAVFEHISTHPTLKPDARTLGAVLRGMECPGEGEQWRTNMINKNGESYDSFFTQVRPAILRSAIRMVETTSNRRLALDILHAEFDRLFRGDSKMARGRFDTVSDAPLLPEFWDVFAQMYDTGPAERVGLSRELGLSPDAGDFIPPPPEVRYHGKINRLAPTTQAMHMLLHVFASNPRQPTENLMSVYGRVWGIVSNPESADEDVKLLKSIYIFNTFLRAFGREMSTMWIVPHILADLSELSAQPTPSDGVSSPSSSQLRPNILTCNILINSFIRAGQLAAADKVRNLMRENEIEPTAMTWNILIAASACIGNEGGVFTGVQKLIQGARESTKEGAGADNPNIKDLETTPDLREGESPSDKLKDTEQPPPAEVEVSKRYSRPSWTRRPKPERGYERARQKWELLPTTIQTLERLQRQAGGNDIVAKVVQQMEREGEAAWTASRDGGGQ